MNKDTIKHYLEMYDLMSDDYYHRCIEALNVLEEKNLMDRFNKIHHMLFIENYKFLKLWNFKDINTVFGCEVHPFTSNLLVISGLQYHQKNMDERGFDAYQREKHKMRLQGVLTNDLIVKGLPGIRISQVVWGTYFIHTLLIECGSLQFEYVPVELPYLPGLGEHLEVHIPAKTSLKKEDIDASIAMAKECVQKYFKKDNLSFHCFSWLLSPQINVLLDDSSNIKYFQSLFDVTEAGDCESDLRNHLFGYSFGPKENLPETTRLQRKVKQALIDGTIFYRGKGKMKI